MSNLESLVLPLAESQSLVEHGVVLGATALVWIAVHEIDDDNDEPTIFPRVDALDDEGDPMWNFVPAPALSELLDVLEPFQSSAEKMVALAHALIALHEEVSP